MSVGSDIHSRAATRANVRTFVVAAHESVFGTTRTSRDVRSSVAIGAKADLSRTFVVAGRYGSGAAFIHHRKVL
jgi:hypothetical protein